MATLNDVIWSNDSYTPRTLLAQFGKKLPVIVQICSGYCGVSEEQTLAASEVVRINSWVNQKRVLARDMRGRLLSIPEDYVIKFEIISQKKKGRNKNHRAKKLKDVLKKYHLPVTVRFDTKTRWKFRVGEEVYESTNFGQMHLVKSYVDTYLLTNPIRNGNIITRVLLFPASIDATMKVAEGKQGMSTTHWQIQLDAYTRALRGVRFDRVRGVIDITVYANTTDEDISDGTSTLQMITPRLGNGVNATDPTPSEIASEKMTQTSVPSSGGTTDANTSITTSVMTEMSSPVKHNDGQHVARIQVVDDAALSPSYISGPVAQMDEMHIRPVTVECNGGLPNGGENTVSFGRPRTYSDGAAGERMWKAKMQRSRSSTIHTYDGEPSPRNEQRVVYEVSDTRNDPVALRGRPASNDRQFFRNVENVRYEPPPSSGYLLQPAIRLSMQRQPIGESVPIMVRDGGSRIGCGRATSSYSISGSRQYQSPQEIYSDNKLHIGLTTDQPVPYRDVYRHSGNYEPSGSVRSERVYIRQNPGPRQQQRIQQLRRHTTMPTGGGHRLANRYAEYVTSGSRDYDMGYHEQRIISRPPLQEFDEYDGEYRASNLGQVTIHGPGLMTTGRYQVGFPPSYGSGRTWMYSEDDRSDAFSRDDQGYREVSRRSTFCGGLTNTIRRTADTADSWVSVVDEPDKATRRRKGCTDSGYDDLAASSFEYVAGSGHRNGREHLSSLPPQHQQGQRQDVFYEEDDISRTQETCTHERGDDNGHHDDMSPGTDYTGQDSGVDVTRPHVDVSTRERNQSNMADTQTGMSTPRGDVSESTSTHTICADDTSTIQHALLVRKNSDQNNNNESGSPKDVATSRAEGTPSRGLDRRGSINSLRDVYNSDKSKTATAELSVFSTSESFNEALNGTVRSVVPARASLDIGAEHATTITGGSSTVTTTDASCDDVTRRRRDPTMPDGDAHDDAVVHLETSARDSIIDLDKFLQAQIEQDSDAHSQVSVDHRPDRKSGETAVVEGNPWYEVTN